MNEAQLGTITPRNVLSGFKNTGIYPFNRNLFAAVDFAPSLVTDRPLEEPIEPDVNVTQDMQQQITNPGADNDAEVAMSQGDEGTPSNSGHEPSHSELGTSSSFVPVSEIMPLPKAVACKTTKKGHKNGSSQVFTDTPVQKEVAACKEKKKGKVVKEKEKNNRGK